MRRGNTSGAGLSWARTSWRFERTMRIPVAMCVALIVAVMSTHATDRGGSCEELTRLVLPGATVTLAVKVEAGAFAPPGGQASGSAPAFCRVAATLKPTQRFRHQDGGLAAGRGLEREVHGRRQRRHSAARLAIRRWRQTLARGYAASSTDTGHDGGSASFALGHPEKLIDFGWRAVHEMTVTSKKDRRRLLRRRPEVLLLERLLGRRPSGDEGSAALPGGLRRHHRRCSPGSTGPAAPRRLCASRSSWKRMKPRASCDRNGNCFTRQWSTRATRSTASRTV